MYTRKTPNYELPQYQANDKPTYLGDFSEAMLKIDTAIKTVDGKATASKTLSENANATSEEALTTAQDSATKVGQLTTQVTQAVQTSQNAQTDATNAISTANTASSNASIAKSTAESANTKADQASSTATSAKNTAQNLLQRIQKLEGTKLFENVEGQTSGITLSDNPENYKKLKFTLLRQPSLGAQYNYIGRNEIEIDIASLQNEGVNEIHGTLFIVDVDNNNNHFIYAARVKITKGSKNIELLYNNGRVEISGSALSFTQSSDPSLGVVKIVGYDED